MPRNHQEFKDLKAFAARLALAYRTERQLEELRCPGLARAAFKLLQKSPEIYVRVATVLMDGEPVKTIAAREGVREEVVRFIRAMHPELVQAARAQLVTNLEEVALAMTQRLLERGEDIEVDKLPVALARVLDKLSVLTGGVTSRVEHVSVPKPEDLERMFASLPSVKVDPER